MHFLDVFVFFFLFLSVCVMWQGFHSDAAVWCPVLGRGSFLTWQCDVLFIAVVLSNREPEGGTLFPNLHWPSYLHSCHHTGVPVKELDVI